MRAAFLTFLMLSIAATAAAQESADRYAEYYGDGIRAYAESRYDDALTNLYRAMAVKPNPFALKLIARVHDFQGNCSARDNSVTMLKDLFPGEKAPPAQRCATVGEVDVVCAPDEGTVRVDGEFDARCGMRLRLPVGTHELENTSFGTVLLVEVVRGDTITANLYLRPNKWYLDPDQRVRARVALPSRWLRPGLRVDPDMPRTFQWKRPRSD